MSFARLITYYFPNPEDAASNKPTENDWYWKSLH